MSQVAVFVALIVAAVLLGPGMVEVAEFVLRGRAPTRRAAEQQHDQKHCTGASKV